MSDLKRGFRPEDPDPALDVAINNILRKLENGGERDELFKEAGDDLLKLGINRMPLYLPVDNDKGGIDFTHPDIITQPISGYRSFVDSPLAINPDLDFEAEWGRIQAVFNSGIRPSARRRDEKDEKLTPLDPDLKDLLAYL